MGHIEWVISGFRTRFEEAVVRRKVPNGGWGWRRGHKPRKQCFCFVFKHKSLPFGRER